MWLSDKSASKSDGIEIQNPNPTDMDFSWLHHIPNFGSVTAEILLLICVSGWVHTIHTWPKYARFWCFHQSARIDLHQTFRKCKWLVGFIVKDYDCDGLLKGYCYGNRFLWHVLAKIDTVCLHSVHWHSTTDGNIATLIVVLTSTMTPVRHFVSYYICVFKLGLKFVFCLFP